MPVFVLFVFGAVILGAGAMLSPAWPTSQPRIGLAATLSLALVVGGTIFYSSLFGWETLVIDYLMFALMTGIFLGGTLAVGQSRAEARGEELLDADQGWPGPQDLSVLACIALLLALPTVLLPVPFGEGAQTYGLMALAMRDGEMLNTLAPFLPDVAYLHAPGFNALTAYLSQQLNAGLHIVQFAAGAVAALLNVWLAYDFGAELRNKRLGRAMALVMLASLGVYGLLINGYYPALMALAFTQGFFIYALRYLRHQYPADLIGAGLLMGATLISDISVFVVLLIGFVPWLATMWLAHERVSVRAWGLLAVGAPVIALAGTAPWLADAGDLFRVDFESPFARSVDHLYVMVQNNGVWVWPLAFFGIWLGWQQRDLIAILAAGWLLMVLDFAVTGGVAAIFPPLNRFVDFGAIGWHGAIIPLTLVGGTAALWLWEMHIQPRIGHSLNYRQIYALSAAGMFALLSIAALNQPLRGLLMLGVPPAYATGADVAALSWISEHTDADALILNHPQTAEGGWTPVIAERRAVFYPMIPFALNQPDDDSLRAFWENPADAANAALLHSAGVDYVFVPQIALDSAGGDFWRDVAAGRAGLRYTGRDIARAAYLQPVYGESVYRVIPPDDE